MTTISNHYVYVSPTGTENGDGSFGRPFKTLDKALEYANTPRVAVNEALFECGCDKPLITASVEISGRRGPRDKTQRCLHALSAMQFVVECELCGTTWLPMPDVGLPADNVVLMNKVTVIPLARGKAAR